MKNIYIVDDCKSSQRNGIGTYINNLLFCYSDLNVSLISYNSFEDEFSIKNIKGITYYKIPSFYGHFLQTSVLSLALLKLYIKDDYENVFFVNHSPCGDFLKNLNKFFPKSKSVFVIHDQGWTSPLLGNRILFECIVNKTKPFIKVESAKKKFVRSYFQKEKRLYSRTDAIVCLNETTYHLVNEVYGIPAEKIFMIPNGVDIEHKSLTDEERLAFRMKYGIRSNEKVLLYAGRLTAAKGVSVLLKALKKVFQLEPNLRFVIIGEVDSYLNTTPFVYDYCSKIVYTGHLAKNDLYQWLQVADVGILPSYTEQCSFFALEMIVNNLLVVTTDGNGLSDMFCDETALITHIDNHYADFSEELSQSILKSIHLSENEKRVFKKNAKDLIEKKYSLNNMKIKYLELLKDEIFCV